jgi:uncharacterized membrane protein
MDVSSRKIKFGVIERLLDAAALLILISSIVYVVVNYSALPEVIPTHFGPSGKPDGYGGKEMIWLLVGVQIFIFATIIATEWFPQLINYPFKVKDDKNEALQIKNAYLMTKILNFIISVMFAHIVYSTIQTANGNMEGLNWIMAVCLASIFLSIGWSLFRGYRISKM